MKKLFPVLLSLITLPGFAQMLEAGNGVAEIGFGFPNIRPISYDAAGNSHGWGFDLGQGSEKDFGQLVVKGEYFVADNLGIAGALCYGYFYSLDHKTVGHYDQNTNLYTESLYFYESKIHKMRFTFGLNFHLLRTSRVDSYFGVQAGSKKAFTNYTSNDPNSGKVVATVFPFALRMHYGLRYFFNEYLAAHLELGLGGPFVNFGATYKF